MAGLNDYLFETARSLAEDDTVPFSFFDGKRVVITGSTGLIGSQLTRALLCRNERTRSKSIELVLPVRNPEKAKALFGNPNSIEYVKWKLGDKMQISGSADLFIHAACSTSSKDFSNAPASTIFQIFDGGAETLRCAKRLSAKKYLFLSTMEVYGEMQGDAHENELGSLDPMVVRNSYPEAKRLVECLCASFNKEFGLPTVVLRLAQTFGQGVNPSDMRVFAEFARSAISNNGITLLSDGTKKNSYLSVDDAVRAIAFTLAKGKSGEAYNAANNETYCSIKEMAELVLESFSNRNAAITQEHDPEREATFRKSKNLRLDTTRLESLGWKCSDSLKDMYSAMLKGWSHLQDSPIKAGPHGA